LGFGRQGTDIYAFGVRKSKVSYKRVFPQRRPVVETLATEGVLGCLGQGIHVITGNVDGVETIGAALIDIREEDLGVKCGRFP
jgi:hypothetical protein